MAKPVGKQQLGQIISHITARLKSYTQKDISRELWREIINAKVSMIHELMSNMDRAIYKDNVILNYESNDKGAIFINIGTPNYYIKAEKRLYLKHNSATFGNINNLSSNQLMDGIIISWGIDTEDRIKMSRIKKVITNNNIDFICEVDYDGMLERINYNEGSLAIKLLTSTEDDILISNTDYYPYIDQILSIHSTGIDDECINVETINNFWGIKKRSINHTYKSSIIYVRDGEYIRFAKGKDVSTYGVRTMYYTRKPIPVINDDDYIDLPEHLMDLLYKISILDGLQVIQVPIPQELKSAENQITAMIQAKEKELADLLRNKGDN